jgi:hypothetical protein
MKYIIEGYNLIKEVYKKRAEKSSRYRNMNGIIVVNESNGWRVWGRPILETFCRKKYME